MRLLRILAISLPALAFGLPASAQTPTIVFLVRHAEAVSTAPDAQLSVLGKARASALEEALSNAGVSAVLTSPLVRNKATVAPLAAKLGIEVTTIAAGSSIAAHTQSVVDAVRKLNGRAVLIVGEGNVINVIAAALGAPKLPDLCAGDYDQLYTLALQPTGPPRFVRSRFGAPATDNACEAMR